MNNPFFLREISLEDPFCDREVELKELCNHAKSLANVVLFSPRRYGKTSLVKRVQASLTNDSFITIYCQFYGVVSEEDVASRLARAIFFVTHKHESLFRKAVRFFTAFRPVMTIEPDLEKGATLSVQLAKSHLNGYELLEEVMQSLSLFIQKVDLPLHIVFDEFQEITTIAKPKRIEGLLREYIQKQKASYLFVGSRRSVLLGMFNDRSRPFYGSAINYQLKPLPKEDFTSFIVDAFIKAGKSCEGEAALKIVSLTQSYPYYGQKLSYFVFDCTKKTASEKEVEQGLQQLLQEETPVFESILMGLAPQQISLLVSLAKRPGISVYSQEFMSINRLSSIGGVQSALKKLSLLDLIERCDAKGWQVVDPIFALWLRQI